MNIHLTLFVLLVLGFIVAGSGYTRAHVYDELASTNYKRSDDYKLRSDAWSSVGTIGVIVGIVSGLAWLAIGVRDLLQVL